MRFSGCIILLFTPLVMSYGVEEQLSRRKLVNRALFSGVGLSFVSLIPENCRATSPTPPSAREGSSTGRMGALIQIIELKNSLETLADKIGQGADDEAVARLIHPIPIDEANFKAIFDAYSDPISYKQKFLDQNAFLVYYTKGFDGPGRPSIEDDLPTRQPEQFGARNEAWVGWSEFLSEWRFRQKNPRESTNEDLLPPLSAATKAVIYYLAQAPGSELDQAIALTRSRQNIYQELQEIGVKVAACDDDKGIYCSPMQNLAETLMDYKDDARVHDVQYIHDANFPTQLLALHAACQGGCWMVVKWIIERDPTTLNVLDDSGSTSLHYLVTGEIRCNELARQHPGFNESVYRNYKECAKILLRKDAEIRWAQNSERETPASRKLPKMQLIKANNGQTPVMLEAREGDYKSDLTQFLERLAEQDQIIDDAKSRLRSLEASPPSSLSIGLETNMQALAAFAIIRQTSMNEILNAECIIESLLEF